MSSQLLVERVMRFLKTLLGRSAKREMGLSEYAKIPLTLMADRAYPFNDWQDPDIVVDEEWRQLFNFYCWAYQLYIFYIVTSQSLGNDAAVRAVEVQIYFQNEILGTHIFDIENSLNNLHEAALEIADNPPHQEVNGESFEMPFDYGMARIILCTDALSPIVFCEKDIGPKTIAELGLCLFHSKQPAFSYFEGLVQGLVIDV